MSVVRGQSAPHDLRRGVAVFGRRTGNFPLSDDSVPTLAEREINPESCSPGGLQR